MEKRSRENIMLLVAAFLGAAFLFRPEIFTSLWKRLSGVVIPVALGIVLSVVIFPAVNGTEKYFLKLSMKKRAARFGAITAVYLAIAGAAAGAVWIVIPRLADSISLFISCFDVYYSDLMERLRASSADDPVGLAGAVGTLAAALYEKLPVLFARVCTAAAGAVKSAGNILVGLVLSVYILAGREQITDFIGGAAQAVMSAENYRRMCTVLRTLGKSLVNFIGGQLTEAVVLGTLCFVGMVIFGFEYPLLISVMIGVTALIPVVGAIAGAVPSALILFLAKPSSALWFIVFIIVLQQLENNLIYPRIVGRSVGLPPILILIAIIMGAQLGGAGGIMIAVPLLSAFYVLAGSCILREREEQCANDERLNDRERES